MPLLSLLFHLSKSLAQRFKKIVACVFAARSVLKCLLMSVPVFEQIKRHDMPPSFHLYKYCTLANSFSLVFMVLYLVFFIWLQAINSSHNLELWLVFIACSFCMFLYSLLGIVLAIIPFIYTNACYPLKRESRQTSHCIYFRLSCYTVNAFGMSCTRSPISRYIGWLVSFPNTSCPPMLALFTCQCAMWGGHCSPLSLY